jgi:hypothetical protein
MTHNELMTACTIVFSVSFVVIVHYVITLIKR